MSHRLIALFAVVLLSASVQAQEWTRFRGPNGAGVSDAKTVPTKWTEKDYNWKIELPADGHGSPVIWGEKIFVVSGEEKTGNRIVTCVNAGDGKIAWSKTYPGKSYRHHGFNAVGHSTPAVDAEQVYAYLGSEEEVLVVALDHNGAEKWKKNLGTFKSKHGPGTSPMLHGDLVIVTSDQDDKSFVCALDRKTGEQKWKIDRKFAGNGASYGVPCVYQAKGDKPQIIFGSALHGMTSVDPDSGKIIWEIGDLMPLRVVASLIVVNDLIITNCGEGCGGKKYAAVRPGSADGTRKPEVAWSLTKGIPYVPTTVAQGDFLYTVTDGGVATCMKAADGEVVWQDRLNDKFFGSPVIVDGHVYVIGQDGNVHVFKADPKQFTVVSKNPLGEKCYTTPAVSGGCMYLRTMKHLISIGGRKVS